MINRIRTIGTLAAALVLSAGVAQAQGKGHGKGHGNGGGDKVPPGLAKKGGLPPGQAKKYRPEDGVVVLRDVFGRHGYTVTRVGSDGDVRYVWYRDAAGRIRRATILPGEERLGFRDIPTIIANEVLARMY